MSPSDNPSIHQDTDWQTPVEAIVQILKDRRENLLRLCKEGTKPAVEGIIQNVGTAVKSLKELDVKRIQMLEQIRQGKETWAEKISSRQVELKQLDDRLEAAARRTREMETEFDLANSRVQQTKGILEIREKALVDID